MIKIVALGLKGQIPSIGEALKNPNEKSDMEKLFEAISYGRITSNVKLASKESAADEYEVIAVEGERGEAQINIEDAAVNPGQAVCTINMLEGGTIALGFSDKFQVNFDGNSAESFLAAMANFVAGFVNLSAVIRSDIFDRFQPKSRE